MSQPERFATAILVLLEAQPYLEQGTPASCVAAHLIASANGYQVVQTMDEDDFSNRYHWEPVDEGRPFMWHSSLNNWRMEHRKGSRQPHAHILTAGFSFEEIDKLELAFEGAVNEAEGLRAAVAALGEIFHIHADVVASALQRFP